MIRRFFARFSKKRPAYGDVHIVCDFDYAQFLGAMKRAEASTAELSRRLDGLDGTRR